MKRIFSREGELYVASLVPLIVLFVFLQKGWFELILHEDPLTFLRTVLFVYCCSMFYKCLMKSIKTAIGRDGSRYIVVTLRDILILGVVLSFCLSWFFQNDRVLSWLVAATLGPYLAYSTLRCRYVLGSAQ
ncbi:MAG TPA: hypothetical protein VL576_02275 [Candidatus Paceibacterota bacterium]|jgi:hypothetical protein|nr:hypothetical protein [Candidatus Paceibacterota bacterium]